MIKRILHYIATRIAYWSGLFFLTTLAVLVICRIAGVEPSDAVIYFLSALCAALLVVDVLAFIGDQTAKLQVVQEGKTLYVRKGSHTVATVLLKDDHPLTEQELQEIMLDIMRLHRQHRS